MEKSNSACLKHILTLQRRGLLVIGHNSRTELQALFLSQLEQAAFPQHGIELAEDGTLFELGSGVKAGEAVGQGYVSTAKLARRILPEECYGDWFIVKVPRKQGPDETGRFFRDVKKDAMFRISVSDESRILKALGYPAWYIQRQPGERDKPPGCLVRPYFEGEALAGFLRENSLSEEQQFACAFSVMGAVSRLHALGYVHNDIKPENLIYNPCENENERIRFIDFDRACKSIVLPGLFDSAQMDRFQLAMTLARIFGIKADAYGCDDEGVKEIKKHKYGSILFDLMGKDRCDILGADCTAEIQTVDEAMERLGSKPQLSMGMQKMR